MAPTERSIWPATITRTMPTARIEVTAICRARSERLRGVRKVPSVVKEKTTQMTSSAPTMVRARQDGRAPLFWANGEASFPSRDRSRPGKRIVVRGGDGATYYCW